MKDNKTRQINIRVSEAEFREIKIAAGIERRSVSNFVLNATLDKVNGK